MTKTNSSRQNVCDQRSHNTRLIIHMLLCALGSYQKITILSFSIAVPEIPEVIYQRIKNRGAPGPIFLAESIFFFFSFSTFYPSKQIFADSDFLSTNYRSIYKQI